MVLRSRSKVSSEKQGEATGPHMPQVEVRGGLKCYRLYNLVEMTALMPLLPLIHTGGGLLQPNYCRSGTGGCPVQHP